jgi:hypothetical protein
MNETMPPDFLCVKQCTLELDFSGRYEEPLLELKSKRKFRLCDHAKLQKITKFKK